ncbi:thiamine phosphate synthase [Luteimonas sp. MC1750]|uniref:thiamine phosphate synthase n=1 Tax=Luteimonas sp. MC1750 TaxID=2799326 RepID=UPI0031B9B29E
MPQPDAYAITGLRSPAISCRSGYSRDRTCGDAIAAIAAPTDTDATAAAVDWLAGLDATLANGISRIQLRLPGAAPDLFRELATAAAARCRRAGAELLVNADVALACELGTGVHLRSSQLATITQRPMLAEGSLLAASCHTAEDLAHAARLGCDFVVLGAVKATASHPGEPGIGWEAFAALRESVSLPVYAIGGLGPEDMGDARRRGGQGIAGIRALWGCRGA